MQIIEDTLYITFENYGDQYTEEIKIGTYYYSNGEGREYKLIGVDKDNIIMLNEKHNLRRLVPVNKFNSLFY